ncbi:hypothetical protein Q5425_40555 [Amycolatopsis sp. A133]|uniref:hypothetical protein n=1 Tax=Amycolatopsis sp. A133 TaxID=3064472 RepID=UPI0027F4D2C1|nr:hypothetical protein [Amycolatopsis sp. A133]MDQ7810056.1 hypothetical protein [Amycolatopsis sp. A133]
MTDESRGIGGTIGPPWSVDVLADLHAGVLDDTDAAELWPLVNADPEARAILDALDATRADLASLADAPAPRMPAEFAARLDAALAAEAAAAFPRAQGAAQAPQQAGPGDAPVVDLAAARRRRNKRLGWAAGVLTAAAAAVVAVTVAIPNTAQQPGTPNVAAPTGPSVGNDGAGAQALVGKAIGVRDFGPLQNEDRLDACIAAAGLDPKVRPEGIRPVNVGGKAGVMIILTTGKLAQFRLVAFGADCGPGNPAVLFDKVVGEK